MVTLHLTELDELRLRRVIVVLRRSSCFAYSTMTDAELLAAIMDAGVYTLEQKALRR
jgi:hypothetical protein